MTASPSPSSAVRAAVDELEGLLAKATTAQFDADRAEARDRLLDALPHLLAAIKAVDELADRFEDEGEQADASGSNFVTVGNWKAADRYAAKADAAHAHAAALRAALALAAVDVTETAE